MMFAIRAYSDRIAPFMIFVAMIALPRNARAADEAVQTWITGGGVAQIDDNDRIGIDVSYRLRPGNDQLLQRITLDHRIADGVQLGGGFAFVTSRVQKEMRFHQQLIVDLGLLQSRTRLEQRYIDSAAQPAWRLRERIQLDIPLEKQRKWFLLTSAEFFFELHRPSAVQDSELVTTRQLIGLRHVLTPRLGIQLSYMRQHSFPDDRPDEVVHVPWLAIAWRL